MKNFIKYIAIFAGLIALAVIVTIILTPWMDRWGATDAEIQATFPGDELVPNRPAFVNRAVTIQARPEHIYPWIVQLGADKGGMVQPRLAGNLITCPRSTPTRFTRNGRPCKSGDPVQDVPRRVWPAALSGRQLIPNQAVVLGHRKMVSGWILAVCHRAADRWLHPA